MFEISHLHPTMVHFPIALILSGFLADVLYLLYKSEWLLKTGFYLMILGTLGALAAFLTGLIFTERIEEGEVLHIYNMHKAGAFTTVAIMVFCSSLRIYFLKKDHVLRLRWGIFFLYLIGALAVSFTGYMGGTMVYSYFLGI